MIVTCDTCKKQFALTKLEQEKTTISDEEIWRTFFRCPSCGEEYATEYDNIETFSLRKQIRKITIGLQEPNIKQKKQKQYLKELKQKQNRLKQCELLLRQKYIQKGE